MDSSQPTFLLTYWVRERWRWGVEEAVRRLTSDTADLFGIRDRGRLAPGAFADVNVIDFDRLQARAPEIVHDLPAGGARLEQRADGFVATARAQEAFFRENDLGAEIDRLAGGARLVTDTREDIGAGLMIGLIRGARLDHRAGDFAKPPAAIGHAHGARRRHHERRAVRRPGRQRASGAGGQQGQKQEGGVQAFVHPAIVVQNGWRINRSGPPSELQQLDRHV